MGKKENISIPSLNAVGVGGAVNIIDNKNILITLNNGELLTFNHEYKIFSEINKKIQGYYSSIRDVAISYEDNRILEFNKDIDFIYPQKKIVESTMR